MIEHCSLLQIMSTSTAVSPLNKRMDRRRRHVCGPGPWLAHVRPDSETPRLETANGCHKVIDIASRRCLTGFEVALNAQSGEEGQDHLRNCRRSHPGPFRLDIHSEKA